LLSTGLLLKRDPSTVKKYDEPAMEQREW